MDTRVSKTAFNGSIDLNKHETLSGLYTDPLYEGILPFLPYTPAIRGLQTSLRPMQSPWPCTKETIGGALGGEGGRGACGRSEL